MSRLLGRLGPLHRKLLRDLWQRKGQMAAIAAVIGAGVAMFVLMLSTFDSLELTQQSYYRSQRFADVFARCERAPGWLERDIEAIPGVAEVSARVVRDVTLDVEGMADPATGHLVSIPADRRPDLNDLHLRSGRWIEPGRRHEVIVSEAFADAHDLGPGDGLRAVVNGRLRRLEIVGVALSPEFVYSIAPGSLFPDAERYGVIWMERRALASAFAMEGAFNDVILTVAPGAPVDAIIDRLDRLLEPYGGTGAIPRALQTSHWYLQNELDQLVNFGAFVPIVFLAVAAFLLNVVVTRIVSLQRGQIAAIKALGHSDRTVAVHYLQWGLLVAAGGVALGLGVGAWLGRGMTRMYADFFHFPILRYTLPLEVVVQAAAIAVASAVLGVLGATRRALALPPAEAMRPEPPARYRLSIVERLGLRGRLPQTVRIIARTIERHPGRAVLSVAGVAAAGGLLVFGTFWGDAIERTMAVQFDLAQRFDVRVSFVEPVSPGGLDELGRLPGVMAAEPFRTVPARLVHGHRSRHLSITGLPAEPRLNRVVDAAGRVVELPAEGLAVSRKLAELLGLGLGEEVTVEVQEGRRPTLRVPVSNLVDDALGLNAYMAVGPLRRLLGETDTLSGAFLMVDGAHLDRLLGRLERTPAVAGVMRQQAAVASFRDTFADMMGTITGVAMIFAGVIAFGVVYNSARISLAERARELASLRVLGMTRSEIATILLGELAVTTALAVPLGLVVGYVLAAVMVAGFDTEVWRLPLVVTPATYLRAAGTVLGATVVSALLIRRKLDRLDLVEVLKTRE
ncbi:MAG TPA: ABC transporter permease [Candidatus Sulfomarinibacteraceae bacterium]|nr:ABC transporter permease [Candidatus Sulfomarinibacteraceae bacterium]